MPLPFALLDSTAVEEIPIPLWRDLFREVGWPPTLDDRRNDLTHAEVVEALTRDELTDEQQLLIDALGSMGTPEGADAIQRAMEDQRVSFDLLPSGAGERELVAHLFLAQRVNASLAGVFSRAQIQVQEHGEPRRFHEYVSATVTRLGQWHTKAAELETGMRTYCAERDLGDHVQVRPFEDNGVYVMQVLHSHRTRKPLAVVRGRTARATIEYRPVHCDHVEYDPTLGRLRIAARAPSMVAFYRRELGRILFDNEDAFGGDPVCSLRPLQDRGRSALEHEQMGIGRVWMTECLWERGDRELLHLRGRNCFDQIETLRLPVTEGEFLSAKLKVEVTGTSTRPVTVTIRAPSRIEISQPQHEALINRFLTGIGVRGRNRVEASHTLWSLAPWRHPRHIWRVVFGTATDTLIEQGVLQATQLASVPAPENLGAGNALVAHAIDDGAYYGVSAVPEIASRTLTSTDLDGFELDPERFRVWLRRQLGMDGTALPWESQDHVLDLGPLTVGENRIHIVYAMRSPVSGLSERLRARVGGTPLVVLCPSTAPTSSALPQSVLDHAIPERADTIRRAVLATGLEQLVPAIDVAPPEARLVVDRLRGEVWVDRRHIRGIKPDTHDFKFVALVAQDAPRAVDTMRLKQELSGARADGDTVTRKAKSQVNRAIKDEMTAAGSPLEGDVFVLGGRGMVRCVLPCFVSGQ